MSTPARAQFRFEWRRMAWGYRVIVPPLVCLAILAAEGAAESLLAPLRPGVHAGIVVWSPDTGRGRLVWPRPHGVVGAGALALPHLLGLLGTLLAATAVLARVLARPDLPGFTARLPVSSGQVAAAKAGAAALQALTSAAILVPALLLLVSLYGGAGDLEQAAGLAGAPNAGVRLGGFVLLGVATLFAVAWGQSVTAELLAEAGPAALVAGGLLLTGACYLVEQFVCAIVGDPGMASELSGPLARLLAASVLLKLLAAGWASYAAWNRHVMSGYGIVRVVGGWGLFVLALCLPACLLLPAWIPGPLVICAAVLVVPLVRLLAAPLVIDWARHR